MLDLLRFWIVLQIFGLIALPLAWRLFAHLPDRGYTLAKALGLLAAGYLLWLGSTFGLLRNTAGGAVLAMLLVLAVGVWLGRTGLQVDAEGNRPLVEDLRRRWRYVLGVEIFFLLALAAWAYFRAYNPEIAGTEKPMEFAFLNGILNSPQFPPRDPWLSGYAISYYYFGYVQLNMLVQLTGVAPGVAFNLGLSSIFALTMVAAFGLVYNLVASDESHPASPLRGALVGLLGSLFVGLMGNLEGVLEMLHVRGVLSPRLQALFDIKDLAGAPVTGSWNPGVGFWWWWRASRTIHDYNFTRQYDQEVIDEFPFFSFLLGDMHPHVLALPFVLLAIALGLNLFRRPPTVGEQGEGRDWRAAWATVVSAFGLDGWGVLVYGLALGALGFLNTWDFPIYVFLIVLVYALRRGLNGARLDRRLWTEVVLAFAILAVVGFVGYLPFYLTFRSQANGLWPNFYNPTRWVQYLLMFGPFLAALIFMLVVAYRRASPGRSSFLRWLLVVLLLPLAFLVLATVLAYAIPGIRTQIEGATGLTAATLLPQIAGVRLATPATWLFAGLLLAAVGALAALVWSGGDRRPGRNLTFALALFFTALLLTYGVEFVFLRDSFGTRMNTVFKFYYQAWIMMAIGSAYAVYYIGTRAAGALRAVALVVMAVLVLGAMVYPVFAIPSKANGFQGDPSLDGTLFVTANRPDEAAVIAWMRANTPADAVILESPGGSYSENNRISAYSGRPTLLGWGGHELQWRGTYDEPGRREPLIETVYRNQDEERIRGIVREFGIDYLVVGPMEMEKYKIAPNRKAAFNRLWQPVFEQGDYTVYAWRGGLPSSAARG